jgi:NAD(P)-dependent dehydrogenase (short-subunit alcohol dehydrogenase family)
MSARSRHIMAEKEQKVAIITGDSQGIGAGPVAAYRQEGWSVVANSRTIKLVHERRLPIARASSPAARPVPGGGAHARTGRARSAEERAQAR